MSEQVKRYISTRLLPDAEGWNQSVSPHTYVRASDHDALQAEAEALRKRARPAQAAPQELRIVLDGPPGPEAGRFVEVENAAGRSVNAGEWRERADGLWELVLHATQGGE